MPIPHLKFLSPICRPLCVLVFSLHLWPKYFCTFVHHPTSLLLRYASDNSNLLRNLAFHIPVVTMATILISGTGYVLLQDHAICFSSFFIENGGSSTNIIPSCSPTREAFTIAKRRKLPGAARTFWLRTVQGMAILHCRHQLLQYPAWRNLLALLLLSCLPSGIPIASCRRHLASISLLMLRVPEQCLWWSGVEYHPARRHLKEPAALLPSLRLPTDLIFLLQLSVSVQCPQFLLYAT